MILARRQKRLLDWREYFSQAQITEDHRKRAEDLLNTFALMIAKLAKTFDEEERKAALEQLLSAEQDLHEFHQQSRLATSVMFRS